MAKVGNDIYFAGSFTAVDGVAANGIVRWDGSSWQPLGSGLNGEGDEVLALDGKIYVVGKFTEAGGVPAQNVACWDGTAWSALGAGLPNFPYAATVHAGHLYAGGGSPPWVMMWNGTTWQGISDPGTGGWVYRMTSFGGDLVIVGDGDLNGLGNALQRWNGTAWSLFHGGCDRLAVGLMPDGDGLLVAGDFAQVGSSTAADRIARWDGGTWQTFPGGFDAEIGGIVRRPEGLYAVGDFTTAGDGAAMRVAAWDGQAWSPVGQGINGYAESIIPLPNGILVAGSFTEAGGLATGYAASCTWPFSLVIDTCSPGSMTTAGGDLLLIGSGLDGITAISLDGQPMALPSNWSATHITIQVPPHAAGIAVLEAFTRGGSATRGILFAAPLVSATSATPATPTDRATPTAAFFLHEDDGSGCGRNGLSLILLGIGCGCLIRRVKSRRG